MQSKREVINSLKHFVRTKYAWPGRYPLFMLCDDGEALCHSCAKDNFKLILSATRTNAKEGWQCAGVDINYEDSDLYCAHCGHRIESAYAEEQ